MAKKKSITRYPRRGNEQFRPDIQATGANSQPIVSRLDRQTCVNTVGERIEDDLKRSPSSPSHNRNVLAEVSTQDSWPGDCPLVSLTPPPHPPPPPPLENLALYNLHGKSSQTVLQTHHVPKVTIECEVKESPAQAMMNANGNHPPHRHQQPHSQPHNQPQRDRRHHVNDNTGVNTPNGPMPSHIQVAKPYVFHQAVEACLSDLGVLQAGEDRIRLAGVQWIDNVRKALKLYVRGFSFCSALFPSGVIFIAMDIDELM